MRNRINYQRIQDAIQFYTDLGYEYIETPWIVETSVTNITKPPTGHSHQIISDQSHLGSFVASAEQGFIYRMLGGKLKPGHRYVSVSPCYRPFDCDPPYHFETFMKVELFQYGDHANDVTLLVDALSFHETFLDSVFSEKLEDGTFDIFYGEDKEKVELGSYGIREYKRHGKSYTWAYGTGLAEPRASLCLEKENKTIKVVDSQPKKDNSERVPQGYHLNKVEKGVLGEFSKIKEEFLELEDAVVQDAKVLVLCELSDLMGSIELYLEKYHPNIKLDDIKKFANMTKNAFLRGDR